MKKIQPAAALAAMALALSACEPLPTDADLISIPANGVLSSEGSVFNRAMTPPFTVGSSSRVLPADGYYGSGFSGGPVTLSQMAAPVPFVPVQLTSSAYAPGFAPTPMAVHANVAGTYDTRTYNTGIYDSASHGGQLTYNGINGVRPFIVNPGSVWNGPSTYMLPLATDQYAHQHLETVGREYTPGSYTPLPVEAAPTVMAAAEKTATATKTTFIRKEPSFGAKKCNVLPHNKTAKLHHCQGRWCKVTYNGETGWASKQNLRLSN